MSLFEVARELILGARADGKSALAEHEVYRLLRAGGLSTPSFFLLSPDGSGEIERLPSERVVVKVVSAEIAHKTEVGGLRIVPNDAEAIRSAAKDILKSVEHTGGEALLDSVEGLLVCEMIESEPGLGGQVFCGMRFSEGMGHVMAVGFGGLEAEALVEAFKDGQAMTLFSPELISPAEAVAKFEKSYAGRLMSGVTREARRAVDTAALEAVIGLFTRLAREVSNRPEHGFVITDLELNPLLVSGERLVPVDAVMRFSFETHDEKSPDLERVSRLLSAKTAALMGVSAKKINIGRIILRNLLREGFPKEAIRVVRPGAEQGELIDDVKCCQSIADLPWEADLAVVAVAAEAVPSIVEEVIETGKASSLVLIPGGMGETEGGKAHQRRVEESISLARREGRHAPVLVGPNCLGIRSKAGLYDTLFIPESKLPLPTGGAGRVALVSQSGAFMITRMNRMSTLDPRYVISTGNQLDLSVTDFVEALLLDEEVSVLGVYIEGFGPMDGQRLARLVRKGRGAGKDFVVYLAGRTEAGRTATSSHTASISGDFTSAAAVLEEAGATMARGFEEWSALLMLKALLNGKASMGTRLGLVSNAGYETVGMADNIEAPFALAKLGASTRLHLDEVLSKHGIGRLVTLQNPLDLTPMASDAAYEECVQAMLEDDGVDALVVGAVPLTMALKTLPEGADARGRDVATAPDALATRLANLFDESHKPMVFVVDAGKLYDPMVELMEGRGLPVFRSSDLAVRALQRHLDSRV